MSNPIDFERIEASFKTISQVPQAWQRLLLLDQSAAYNGFVKSSYRKAFELWRLERSTVGKGGDA
ncbi:MAG: hypothetical protein ACAF41_11820 [Leptolyngbya sp. BL-A-14]